MEGPYTLDVGFMLGTSRRLDDAPLLPITQRQGLMFGLGLGIFLSRRISVGLDYEHLDLGAEESGLTDFGLAAVTRDLNSAWLTMRLYPLRSESVGGFLRIGLGAAWQSAQLAATLLDPVDPSLSVPLQCEGSDSVGFGLRGDLGVDAALGAGVRFNASLGLDSYRLSDQLLSDCVPGAGTATVFGLRSGFVYGWEP